MSGDVTTLNGWLEETEKLAIHTKGLGKYAKVEAIGAIIECLKDGKTSAYHDDDVYIFDKTPGVWVVATILDRWRSGERLTEALRALKSPVVGEVNLVPIGLGKRCEVHIIFKPRPAK